MSAGAEPCRARTAGGRVVIPGNRDSLGKPCDELGCVVVNKLEEFCGSGHRVRGDERGRLKLQLILRLFGACTHLILSSQSSSHIVHKFGPPSKPVAEDSSGQSMLLRAA